MAYSTITSGDMNKAVTRWQAATQNLRRTMWSKESDLTSAESPKMHRVMTLDDIDKRYFARPLRNTLKKTVPDARPRQLLAILALGLDVSLAISAYVSDLAKNSEIGRKDWRLWYVWVALLNAIIRESQTNCEHFNKLVADLQQTLPELPAKHRGEGLNRDIKVALQWADQLRRKTYHAS